MAVITYGAAIATARGSIGGLTLSNNKSGSFGRSRIKTPTKTTPAAQMQKANFTAAVQAWSSLDPAYIAQWNLAAPAGISGFNLFVAYYLNAIKIDVAPISAPIAPTALTPIVLSTVGMSASIPVMTAVLAAVTQSDCLVVIFASNPSSPGKAFNRGKLKMLGFYDFTVSTSADLTTDYINTFGFFPNVGQIIYFTAELIHGITINALPATVISAECFS